MAGGCNCIFAVCCCLLLAVFHRLSWSSTSLYGIGISPFYHTKNSWTTHRVTQRQCDETTLYIAKVTLTLWCGPMLS